MREMRVSGTANGERTFPIKDCLTASQISSYFSRPSLLNTEKCKVVVVGLWFNVPVNTFSVMLGQTSLPGYLPVLWGASSVFLKETTRRPWGSNPGPLHPESDALLLGHRATSARL